MKEVYLWRENGKDRSIFVSNSFIQTYKDIMGVFYKITSPCAMHLLFWIVQRMDSDNIVSIRKPEKLDFISENISNGNNSYSISSINKSIKILSDLNIIVSNNEKGQRLGQYIVNPIYFWRNDSDLKRENKIADVLKIIKEKDESNRI